MKFGKISTLRSSALAITCAWTLGLSGAVLAANNTEVDQKGRALTALGNRFTMLDRVAAQQTRVIFYRPATHTQPGAATVYVNGSHHASLIPGAYAELCMPPNKAEIGVRMVKVGDRPKDSLDTITVLTLNPGQTTFMRLREQGSSRVVLQPIAASEALAELQATREQIHTISRVPGAVECMDGGSSTATATPIAPATAPAAVMTKPQQINLEADALFAFGKSDPSGMTLAGRQSLDNLVSQIKGEYINIDRIHVIGHADPLGNQAINERLANDRAMTVREYLLSHGLQNTRITSQGKGSREPVLTTCSPVISPASVLCNKPNRRVVVEISGVHRGN